VSRGALLPMVEHLLWTSRNYGAANHVPYGGIPGGYGVLFEDASRGELLLRAVFTFFIALPALLPPVALVWFLPKYRRSEPALLLLVCAAGLLVSCLPRWDLDHLEYVEPVFLALAGAWLVSAIPQRAQNLLGVIFASVAAIFLFTAVSGRLQS